MAQREIRNSIQMGHFANLKAVAATIPEGSKESVVIGYVSGKANGVSYRANPNGSEPSIGILGKFEGISAEAGRAIMVAPMIFLPDALAKTIEAELVGSKEDFERPAKAPDRKAKPIDVDGIGVIPIALEIGIRRANTATGYEFAIVQHGDESMSKVDDLADVRALLPAQVVRDATPALPAPSNTKRKGKKAKAS